ncbi:MAG: hypothetical protein AB7O37_07765 [Vicinamibacteria bacterium]
MPGATRKHDGWDAALVGLTALAWALKAAVAAGLPRGWLVAGVVSLSLVALAGALMPRRPGRWLDGWRAALVIAGALAFPDVYGTLGGDGYEYYVYARSALLDRDLDFSNDFAGLGARPATTPDGAPTSRVPFGQALVWAPFLLLTHAAVATLAALGFPLAPDGFSPPYTAGVTGASFLLGFVALGILERLLRPRFGPALSLLTVLGLLYATPLHFYLVANPFMSHGTQVFAATLFAAAWVRARRHDDARGWLWAGAAGALMSVVRAQDGVLLAVPLLDLLARRIAGRSILIARYLLFPAAAVLAQTLLWRAAYGPDFVQVVAEMNWVGKSEPDVLGVLFSPRHGLFTWTPLLALGALGLVAGLRRNAALCSAALAACALAVYVNAGLLDWWGSDSFGQRRLLVLTPALGLGVAEALALLVRRPLLLLVPCLIALAGWNRQLAYVYQAELVAPKNQPITLDALVPAQLEVVTRKLMAARAYLPEGLWVVAYDNLCGIYLDEGPRSLRGSVDIGGRDQPALPGGLLGDGWFGPELEEGTTLRRIRGRRAWLRLPLRRRAALEVVVRLRGEYRPESEPLRFRLEWNGAFVGESAPDGEWREHVFRVNRPQVRVGVNDVALVVSPTPREQLAGFSGRNVAAAVDWIRLRRLGD